MTRTLHDKAAIAGIGATEFSKESGRSELRLAVEAIGAALDDAGLRPQDVDGMSVFTMENNPEIEVFRQIGGRMNSSFSAVSTTGAVPPAPRSTRPPWPSRPAWPNASFVTGR